MLQPNNVLPRSPRRIARSSHSTNGRSGLRSRELVIASADAGQKSAGDLALISPQGETSSSRTEKGGALAPPQEPLARVRSRGPRSLWLHAARPPHHRNHSEGRLGTAGLKPRPFPRRESSRLLSYYERLLDELGAQGWWPARTRLEVILGAILTQNTAWGNAARAIAQLRQRGLLSLKRMRALDEVELQSLIRPAGFFTQKARAIRGFLDWLETACGGSLDRMFAMAPEQLRAALLGLKGFGPETADAILLYAGGKPFFVADAYTRRILARHAVLSEHSGYDEAQRLIHRELERDAGIYNEFHALLVEVGKRYCRREAMNCHACPLEKFLPGSTAVSPVPNFKVPMRKNEGRERPPAPLDSN
jgi:endonuclease III related protein